MLMWKSIPHIVGGVKAIFSQLFAFAVEDDAGGAEVVPEDIAPADILAVIRRALEGCQLAVGGLWSFEGAGEWE